MATPADILERRYGTVFLLKSENLNIVSAEDHSERGKQVSVYSAVLDTGSVTPVVLVALVDGDSPQKAAALSELKWSSIHIRSYNSWDDIAASGLEIPDTDARKPVAGALKGLKDLKIYAVAETKTSKTYQFENVNFGKLTVFTSKPIIATGGNDLPNKTTFLPWLAESNFVYERA